MDVIRRVGNVTEQSQDEVIRCMIELQLISQNRNQVVKDNYSTSNYLLVHSLIGIQWAPQPALPHTMVPQYRRQYRPV